MGGYFRSYSSETGSSPAQSGGSLVSVLNIAYKPSTGRFFASFQGGHVYTGTSVDALAWEIAKSNQTFGLDYRARPGVVKVRSHDRLLAIKGAIPATDYISEIDELPSRIEYHRKILYSERKSKATVRLAKKHEGIGGLLRRMFFRGYKRS